MPHRVLVAQQLAELFSVLSHPLRVRIILELRSGEMCVNSLVDAIGARQSTVSQHLALLKSRHLIKERRDGRHILYRLSMPGMSSWLVDGIPLIVPDDADSRLLRLAAARALCSWKETNEENQSGLDEALVTISSS